jgi:hypothetical protein
MRRIWRENSLSIVMVSLFLIFLLGQSLTGEHEYNQDQQEHGEPPVGYAEYLRTPHFVEAVFENWESEFLQMGVYVLFTGFLRQKGSSESKALDKPDPVDEDPREHKDDPAAPGPVRKGGWRLSLYSYSLSISFLVLFLFSFWLHALGSLREFNAEQLAHGSPPISLAEHLGSARFWFESLQNWQSEFLAVAAIVLLSIVLRQKGSPESKPVATPHHQTGKE